MPNKIEARGQALKSVLVTQRRIKRIFCSMLQLRFVRVHPWPLTHNVFGRGQKNRGSPSGATLKRNLCLGGGCRPGDDASGRLTERPTDNTMISSGSLRRGPGRGSSGAAGFARVLGGDPEHVGDAMANPFPPPDLPALIHPPDAVDAGHREAVDYHRFHGRTPF